MRREKDALAGMIIKAVRSMRPDEEIKVAVFYIPDLTITPLELTVKTVNMGNVPYVLVDRADAGQTKENHMLTALAVDRDAAAILAVSYIEAFAEQQFKSTDNIAAVITDSFGNVAETYRMADMLLDGIRLDNITKFALFTALWEMWQYGGCKNVTDVAQEVKTDIHRLEDFLSYICPDDLIIIREDGTPLAFSNSDMVIYSESEAAELDLDENHHIVKLRDYLMLKI